MTIQFGTLQPGQPGQVFLLPPVNAVERRRCVTTDGELEVHGVPGLRANLPCCERAEVAPESNIPGFRSRVSASRSLPGDTGKQQGFAEGFLPTKEMAISTLGHLPAAAALTLGRQAVPVTIEAAIPLPIFSSPQGDSLNTRCQTTIKRRRLLDLCHLRRHFRKFAPDPTDTRSNFRCKSSHNLTLSLGVSRDFNGQKMPELIILNILLPVLLPNC